MAVSKQKKEETLKNLEKNLKKAKFVIFVNFHGLNVGLANNLRKVLREIGSVYMVAKKTLIKKALEVVGIDGEMPGLDGEVSIVMSENDSIEPAKILYQFAKKNKDKIKLLGGVFENKYIGGENMVILANIPPKEILIGQFVNIINSPIQGLVVALNEIAKIKK